MVSLTSQAAPRANTARVLIVAQLNGSAKLGRQRLLGRRTICLAYSRVGHRRRVCVCVCVCVCV